MKDKIKKILLTPIEEKDKGKSFLVGWVSEKQIQQILSLIKDKMPKKINHKCDDLLCSQGCSAKEDNAYDRAIDDCMEALNI